MQEVFQRDIRKSVDDLETDIGQLMVVHSCSFVSMNDAPGQINFTKFSIYYPPSGYYTS